jgi:hypothetical protein
MLIWQRSAAGLAPNSHHRTGTFQEEYRELLGRHGVDFDDRYALD